MKILLDEDVPHRLRRYLEGHDVATVQRMGWASIKNGALIQLAVEAGFEVMISFDQNMEFQQNLRRVKLAVVVIVVKQQHMDTILPLVPAIMQALPLLRPGEFARIE